MAKFFQGMKLIDHVRCINILICSEVYGRFFYLSVPKRDLDTKITTQKYKSFSSKTRSNVTILLYRTWPSTSAGFFFNLSIQTLTIALSTKDLSFRGHICRCKNLLGAITLNSDFELQIHCPTTKKQRYISKIWKAF